MHSTGLVANECQKLPLTLSSQFSSSAGCSLPDPAHSAPVWVSRSSGLCFSAGFPRGGCQFQALIRSEAGPSRMHVGLAGLVSCWQLLRPPWGAQSLLGDTGLRSHAGAPGLPPTAPEVLWHWLATHTALVSPTAHHPWASHTTAPASSLHTTDMQPDPLGTEPCSTEMNTILLLTGVRGLPAFTFQ